MALHYPFSAHSIIEWFNGLFITAKWGDFSLQLVTEEIWYTCFESQKRTRIRRQWNPQKRAVLIQQKQNSPLHQIWINPLKGPGLVQNANVNHEIMNRSRLICSKIRPLPITSLQFCSRGHFYLWQYDFILQKNHCHLPDPHHLDKGESETFSLFCWKIQKLALKRVADLSWILMGTGPYYLSLSFS